MNYFSNLSVPIVSYPDDGYRLLAIGEQPPKCKYYLDVVSAKIIESSKYSRAEEFLVEADGNTCEDAHNNFKNKMKFLLNKLPGGTVVYRTQPITLPYINPYPTPSYGYVVKSVLSIIVDK